MKKTEVMITTLLGRGSEVSGDFSVKGSARIDGKVDGNVTVTGSLVVGAGAVINGDVSANAVLIGGEVYGNVDAPEKTELTGTAKVLGNITTKVIVIDEKAIFQGACNMNQATPDKKAKSNTAKAIRAGRKSAKSAIAEALKEVEEERKLDEKKEADAAKENTAPVSENV